jgi:hypothetical protein
MTNQTTRIKLQRVVHIPKELEQGVLYVSEEFETAAHLCACGCGAKIRTPLGPTEWTFYDTPAGPTLRPSIGNWQQPCKSHYIINKGHIIWASQWSDVDIMAGRAAEELRRKAYYDNLYKNNGILRRAWNWIKKLFS